MSGEFSIKDAPLLYGLGEDGRMHHVDDVPRGKACRCVCPSSDCGHPLIARQGDVMMHSFAHAPGATCDWGVEAMLANRAYAWLSRVGFFMFPKLTYRHIDDDAFKENDLEYIRIRGQEALEGYERDVCLSAPAAVRVSGVSLVKISGRVAPEVYLTVDGAEDSKCYIVVLTFSHKLTESQLDALLGCCDGVIVCDMSREFKRLMREASDESRHFDRSEILLSCQSDETLKRLLFDASSATSWAYHPLAESRERERCEAWREAYDDHCARVKERYELEQKRQETMRAEHERSVRERARRASEEYFARMTSPAYVSKLLMEEKRNSYRQKMVDAQRAYDFFDANIIENDRMLAREFAQARDRADLEDRTAEEVERYIRLCALLDDPNIIALDETHRRVYRCKECGCIGYQDEFIIFSDDHVNRGVCKKCVYPR